MKVLFLGAGPSQVPPIRLAKEMGYTIITCDNIPSNPGHYYADKVLNISILNSYEILREALVIGVDSVLSYASDAGCITQMIVCEALGLPHNPLEVINILTNKFLFRKFLNNNGIQESTFELVSRGDEDKILDCIDINSKKIIKPVDSNGSRGVSLAINKNELKIAIDIGFKYSRSGNIVIEDFFEKKGFQVCGDGFFDNNKILYIAFGDGWFYKDSFVPFAESFPGTHTNKFYLNTLIKIEKILQKLNFKIGAFNFDVINVKDVPYVIEIAPRSGGNYISNVIKEYEGVDLVNAALHCNSNYLFKFEVEKTIQKNYAANYMIHSMMSGILKNIYFDNILEAKIVEKNIYISIGEKVDRYVNGSNAIGNIVLRFDNKNEMSYILSNMTKFIKIELE